MSTFRAVRVASGLAMALALTANMAGCSPGADTPAASGGNTAGSGKSGGASGSESGGAGADQTDGSGGSAGSATGGAGTGTGGTDAVGTPTGGNGNGSGGDVGGVGSGGRTAGTLATGGAAGGRGGGTAPGTGGVGTGMPGTGGGATAGQTGGGACPAGTFICETFESYPTGAAPPTTSIWTKTLRGGGALAVDATRASSGSKSLHVTGTINGDVAHLTTPVSITANTVFVRFMMYTISYPSSSGVHSRLARLGTTGDSGPDSAYSLSSYNGTAIEKVDSIYLRSTATHLNDASLKNRWVCLEFEIDKTGGKGNVVPHIWVDGSTLSLAAAGSTTHAGTSASWDPIAFELFTIGLEGNQADSVKGDFWLDDIMIASARVGCPK